MTAVSIAREERGRRRDRGRRRERTGERSRIAGRRPTAAVAVALATAVWASPGPPAARPSELVVTADVQARLDVLAVALNHEIVLCLLGHVRGGRAVATELYMPVPISSSATTVVSGPCPAPSVATWHNHPTAGIRITGRHVPLQDSPNGSPPSDGWSAEGERPSCRPSRRDVTTAVRLRIPFLVISDGVGSQCIWSLEQLETFLP